jgi:hypothetical protein
MCGRIIFGSHHSAPRWSRHGPSARFPRSLQWRSQSRDGGNSTAQDGRTDAGAAVPGPYLSVPGQERRRPDNTMPKPLTGGRYFAIPIRADVVSYRLTPPLNGKPSRDRTWSSVIAMKDGLPFGPGPIGRCHGPRGGRLKNGVVDRSANHAHGAPCARSKRRTRGAWAAHSARAPRSCVVAT